MDENVLRLLSDPDAIALMTLDMLPGHCAIDTEIRLHTDGEVSLRFRATRPGGRLVRKRETSDWSGWFRYEGEPVALTWAAFWPPVEAS